MTVCLVGKDSSRQEEAGRRRTMKGGKRKSKNQRRRGYYGVSETCYGQRKKTSRHKYKIWRPRQPPHELTSTIDSLSSILLDFAFVFGSTKRKPNESQHPMARILWYNCWFCPSLSFPCLNLIVFYSRWGPSLCVLLCSFLDAMTLLRISFLIMPLWYLYMYYCYMDTLLVVIWLVCCINQSRDETSLNPQHSASLVSF